MSDEWPDISDIIAPGESPETFDAAVMAARDEKERRAIVEQLLSDADELDHAAKDFRPVRRSRTLRSIIANRKAATHLDRLAAENAALRARLERVEAAARQILDLPGEGPILARLGAALGNLRAALDGGGSKALCEATDD